MHKLNYIVYKRNKIVYRKILLVVIIAGLISILIPEDIISENDHHDLGSQVIDHNRNHVFDKKIYKNFGSMGLLGSTVKGYGSPEINKVSYGLIL